MQVCGTTPCWLRGAEELESVCRKLIGEPDHVTEDGLFSWTEVECLGACVNAPMVQINRGLLRGSDAGDVSSGSSSDLAGDAPRGAEPGPSGWTADHLRGPEPVQARPTDASQPVEGDS